MSKKRSQAGCDLQAAFWLCLGLGSVVEEVWVEIIFVISPCPVYPGTVESKPAYPPGN